MSITGRGAGHPIVVIESGSDVVVMVDSTRMVELSTYCIFGVGLPLGAVHRVILGVGGLVNLTKVHGLPVVGVDFLRVMLPLPLKTLEGIFIASRDT